MRKQDADTTNADNNRDVLSLPLQRANVRDVTGSNSSFHVPSMGTFDFDVSPFNMQIIRRRHLNRAKRVTNGRTAVGKRSLEE